MLANAITEKGVATASDATFQIMANNISNILISNVPSGSNCGSGKTENTSYANFTLYNGLYFVDWSFCSSTKDNNASASGGTGLTGQRTTGNFGRMTSGSRVVDARNGDVTAYLSYPSEWGCFHWHYFKVS